MYFIEHVLCSGFKTCNETIQVVVLEFGRLLHKLVPVVFTSQPI